MDPLPSAFYRRPAEQVARDLLGARIVTTFDGVRTVGRIVETEAYVGPHDEASHACERIGRTDRNEAMFAAPGIAYVYRIYGVHWCLNAVTDRAEYPAAVLIRAAEPEEGLETMEMRRGGRPHRDLLRGPGNLCAGLGIDGRSNFHALDRSPLLIVPGTPLPGAEVGTGPRIGITRAADLPLRFWERGNRFVSRNNR